MAGKTTEELLQELINLQKIGSDSSGGGGGARAAGGGGAAEQSIDAAAKAMNRFTRTTEAYGKVSQGAQFAANLFNKNTEKAAREMSRLDAAISKQKETLERLIDSGKKASSAEYKKVESDLRGLQSTQAMYQSQSTAAGILRDGAATMGGAFKQIYMINSQYQIQMDNLMAEGASGFQLAAAGMTAAIDKMNAENQAMAQIAQSAGQSISQLGGKFAPVAGLALNVLGQAASAASEAQANMAKNGIRIMAAEGDKLIKTHKEMTGSGLVFANGMQGMINATQGTKLRLEDMSAVVKENKEAFLNSGIGIAEATKRVGNISKMFASTTGSMAKMDRQLLALGFSYQEQAALSAGVMADMKKGAGGDTVSDKAIAESTAGLAQNMSLLAQLSGEDAKRQKEKVKAENATLAFEMEKAKMSPKQRAELDAAMAQMTEQERQNLRERMVYGTVINKQGAIMEAMTPTMKENGEAYANQLKNNALTVESVAGQQSKNAKKLNDEVMKNGKGIALAADAGKGGVDGVAKAYVQTLEKGRQTTQESVDAAKDANKKQMEAAKGKGKGDATSALLDAAEAGAIGAKKLQEGVVKKIGEIAGSLKKHYDDILRDLNTKMPGSNGLMEAINKYFPLLIAGITVLSTLNSFGVFKGLKDSLNRLLTKSGEPGSGDDLTTDAKGRTRDSKGRFTKKPPAKVGMFKRATNLAKGINPGTALKVVAGGAAVIGNVLNVVSAVGDVMDEQKAYNEAKLAGDQEGMDKARAAQGSAVGGAVGGIAGTAIGAMLGGPIGAAVGGYLGNMAGSWMGEKVGPYWDTMTKKAGEMWDTTKAVAGQVWEKITATMGELATKLMKVLGEAGTWIWETIKKSQLFKVGTYIFDAVKNSPLGTFATWLGEKIASAFEKVKGVFTGITEWISEKISGVIPDWIKNRFSGKDEPKPPAAATTAPAAPAAAPTTAAKPSAPGTAPTSTSPSKASVPSGPAPALEKKALTAAEKAAVNETIATNTKYTNDIMEKMYKSQYELNRAILAQLTAIASHSGDSAAANKKVARNQ